MAQNTISDELNRIIQAKAGIKSALEEKGLTIGDSSTLDEFPGLIQEMETGGGNLYDTSVIMNLCSGYPKINELIVPNGVTTIRSYAFCGANIDTLTLPNTVTTINNEALKISQIKHVNLPNSITSILSNAFNQAMQLQEITIPENVSSFNDVYVQVPSSIFQQCTSLTDVSILCPVRKLSNSMFLSCSKLKNIYFADCSIDNIPQSCFSGCSSLEKAFIPNTIKTIGQYAFENNTSINNVCIPSTITSIDRAAFKGCNNLKDMVILSTQAPTLGNNQSLNDYNKTFPIYVKNEAVETYKNAGGNWTSYTTRITPLAAINYDEETLTVTALGRDNLELYIDSSLCDSSVYTFDSTTQAGNHTVTVKSVDPNLGVLDEVSQEFLIEGEEIDYSTQYFGISALADSSIGINTLKTDGELLYSEDQENWTQWDYANETLDLLTGETLYFKGNNGGHPCVWDKPLFNITGSVNLHGNISSILWGDDYLTNNTIGDGGMAYAFKNSPAIINCKNLIMAPTYNACYEGCFYNCTNLITAPQLPSLSPAQRAYNNMFYGCTSLTKAPDLPALNYSANCYNYMFNGCTNLNYINAMFTNAPSTLGTSNWVKNVSSTGTFVMNKDATWDPEEYRGVSGIPEGWTVETAES